MTSIKQSIIKIDLHIFYFCSFGLLNWNPWKSLNRIKTIISFHHPNDAQLSVAVRRICIPSRTQATQLNKTDYREIRKLKNIWRGNGWVDFTHMWPDLICTLITLRLSRPTKGLLHRHCLSLLNLPICFFR